MALTMSRLKIKLPETLPFDVEIDVRIGDINYGGHLGNDALLRLMHEARLALLGRYGLSEINCGGAGLIMRDVEVVYLAEAFHGDRLRFSLGVDAVGRTGADLYYHVVRLADSREIARARTGMAFFDYERRKPARTPDAFRAAFGG